MKKNELNYELPQSHWFKTFLWECAGGDRFLLEHSTYSDQVKYMCLGGIVLATGLMASLAGGYAFYTIFSPKSSDVLDRINSAGTHRDLPTDIPTAILSIVFGIIWGLIIFNIDRFIVAATGKGDGTEKITKQEFLGAVPRIIMGAIIAITISKPVEIRMFKSEIDVELQNAQMIKEKEFRTKVDEEFNAEVARIQKDIDKFNLGIKDKIERHKVLEQNYIEEARIVTVGPRALAMKSQMDAIQREIEQAEAAPEYQNLLAKKKELEEERKEKLKNSYKVAGGLDGLLERIKIAHDISGNISIFITLLFLAIELTPVFFKLMLIKSPYDFLKDNLEDEIRARNGIEVKYDYYKDKTGLERHLVINHNAENLIYEKGKLSRIQKELTDFAIQKYKEREMKNIEENLDDYISKTDFGKQIEREREKERLEKQRIMTLSNIELQREEPTSGNGESEILDEGQDKEKVFDTEEVEKLVASERQDLTEESVEVAEEERAEVNNDSFAENILQMESERTEDIDNVSDEPKNG